MENLALSTAATLTAEDVNRLDADTAHLEQTLGDWVPLVGGGSNQVTTDPLAVFGTKVYEYNPATGGSTIAVQTEEQDADAATEYSVSLMAGVRSGESGTGITCEVRYSYINAAHGSIGTSAVVPVVMTPGAALTAVTLTATSPALTAYIQVQVIWRGTSMSADANWIFDKVCWRTGADNTFVPSLDVVSTLYEVVNPGDLTHSYVKGTGITLGAAWAGGVVEYARYDGADTSAPLVARVIPSAAKAAV